MMQIIESGTLLFVLLNPFLLSVYLAHLIAEAGLPLFSRIAVRAGTISAITFVLFAWMGDFIFARIFQVHFSSFLIFGGVLFLVIGLRMMLTGGPSIGGLRGGGPGQVAGAVALPFMVGPGTISASVVIGKRLETPMAAAAILLAVFAATFSLIALKALHDFVQARNEALLERYVDITGRVIALFTGTYAVEMITRGLSLWIDSTGAPLS
jgi:multiple antibiotic resistance protein